MFHVGDEFMNTQQGNNHPTTKTMMSLGSTGIYL
jgi:hypothetical protein